jgi:hypothetical protein
MVSSLSHKKIRCPVSLAADLNFLSVNFSYSTARPPRGKRIIILLMMMAR